MLHRKGMTAALAAGLAVALFAPTSLAATKTTKPKKAAKTTKAKKGATTTKATAGTGATAATTASSASATSAPAPAKKGGKIVFAVGAESNGWLPATQNWAQEGGQVRWSVIENLTSFNDKGEVVGWLLDSMVPNSDYTVWTLNVRKGIKFHNGEPLNADAVVQNLNSVRTGLITANVFLNLVGCTAKSEFVVECTMKKPWVSFPAHLAGSAGAIVAPAQIKANDAKNPIGTGPFKFKEWVPNVRFVAVRNPDYWQKGQPVADEIEFRVILDDNARIAQLKSGQINYATTNTAVAVGEYVDMAKKGDIKVYETEGPTAINYDLLNTAVPPFNNRDCRLAAAQALDIETLIKLRAPGFVVANGPFSKGALGYLADSGFPKYDLDKAKASFEKCKAASPANVAFTMATTTSPEAIETRNIKKQMVERAGFTIRTVEIGQDSYIPAALVGSFQWQTWRNHGFPDPDVERIWWHSETAIPAPGIALNFGRVRDNIIDQSLDQIRANSDPAVRKRAAEAINQQFADQVYAIWNWPSRYTLGTCKQCGGFEDQRMPNGDKPLQYADGIARGLGYLYAG